MNWGDWSIFAVLVYIAYILGRIGEDIGAIKAHVARSAFLSEQGGRD